MRFRNVGSLVIDLVVGGMVTMLAMTFSDPKRKGFKVENSQSMGDRSAR